MLLSEQLKSTDFRRVTAFADTRATPNRFAIRNIIGPDGPGDAYINYPGEQAADVRVAILNNESGTLRGYKDGVALASTVTISNSFASTTCLDLGRQQGSPTLDFTGKIFSFGVIDKELNSGELGLLNTYLSGKAGL